VLDASLLLMPLVHFVAPTDPRDATPPTRQPRVWPPVGVGQAGGLIGQSCESPAVALIVGAGLAWTVSMISELSMPWR
jgi:hypothetical protein